jgi:membrane protein
MPKLASALRVDWGLFAGAASAWSSHNAQRLGAALAYYSILSLAPLLLICVSIAGFVFGRNAVRGEIYWQMRAVAGPQGAAFVQDLLKSATEHPASGILAGALGFILLLLGASGVFIELRDDLNYIWDVPAKQGSLIGSALRYRLYSFALVIGSGLLITFSLAANIAIQTVEKFASGYFPMPAVVFETTNFGATVLATTFLFSLIYTALPGRRVPWTDVVVGSIVTAVLFAMGRFLMELYFGHAGVGSLYGAAGSLIVLLVWVYYSSQIFLFGAEFTHVYSQRHGALKREALQKRTVKTDTPVRA